MNLTEASLVEELLRRVYTDRDPDHPDAIAAARELARRTDRPLASSGRRHISPRHIQPQARGGNELGGQMPGPSSAAPSPGSAEPGRTKEGTQ